MNDKRDYWAGLATAHRRGEAEGEAKGIEKVVKLLRSKRVSPDILAAVQALK